MHIILKNEKKIYGKSWEEVLQNLKDSTYFEQTMEEYMAGVAGRAKIFNGKEIKYTDAESFLKELGRIGIIKIEERPMKERLAAVVERLRKEHPEISVQNVCIFEKRICRYAKSEAGCFECMAPSDNEMTCKK